MRTGICRLVPWGSIRTVHNYIPLEQLFAPTQALLQQPWQTQLKSVAFKQIDFMMQLVGHLVDFLLALHHTQQRVVEPVLELRMAGKDLGHEEVHQRPQLHQVILQRRACNTFPSK